MQHLSKSAALRATARRFRVFRSVGQYWVRDLGSTAHDVSVPDYWHAREIAIRLHAEAAITLMGMQPDDAESAVAWAIERGERTVRDIVACVADGI